MSYTHFALAGTGNIGHALAAALLSTSPFISLRILSRSHIDVPAGATLSIVDYASPASLSAALADVQVVISALNVAIPGVLDVQETLATAAKERGVRLFVPSEFGNPTDTLPLEDKSPLGGKRAFHEVLKR